MDNLDETLDSLPSTVSKRWEKIRKEREIDPAIDFATSLTRLNNLRSMALAQAASVFSDLMPRKGIGELQKITKLSRHTLSIYGSTWDRYLKQIKEFKRLPLSYFAVLKNIGVDTSKAGEYLAEAEDQEMGLPKFTQMVKEGEGKLSSPRPHKCYSSGCTHGKEFEGRMWTPGEAPKE